MFIYVVFATAFAMEAIGSYISIVGLSLLFGGILTINLMVIVLDIAKIATVTILYKYWKTLNIYLKTYMLISTLVLMTITSTGVFGFLSSTFMNTISHTVKSDVELNSLTQQKSKIETQISKYESRKNDINTQIANLPSNSVNGRRQLISTYKPELYNIQNQIKESEKELKLVDIQLSKIQSEKTNSESHIGSIVYLSKLFGITLEESTKYIILIIIAVFDPLAILLIIAGNHIISIKSKEPEKEELEIKEVEEPEIEEPEVLIDNTEKLKQVLQTINSNSMLDNVGSTEKVTKMDNKDSTTYSHYS